MGGWIGFYKNPGEFTQICSNRPDACPSRGTDAQRFCAVLKYKKYNPSGFEGFRWIHIVSSAGTICSAACGLAILRIFSSPHNTSSVTGEVLVNGDYFLGMYSLMSWGDLLQH